MDVLPATLSAVMELGASGHDVDKLDKTQERATDQKKMMKRLEGLNDEERLKKLNMYRLAKC